MEEVKEKLTIVVDEEDDSEDITYTLNTLQGNKAFVETKNIQGELDAIIVETNGMTDILINFTEHPEIVLYDVRGFVGTKYVPLRVSPISFEGEQFNFGPQKWNLNNQLTITIQGGLNTETKFTLRLD